MDSMEYIYSMDSTDSMDSIDSSDCSDSMECRESMNSIPQWYGGPHCKLEVPGSFLAVSDPIRRSITALWWRSYKTADHSTNWSDGGQM